MEVPPTMWVGSWKWDSHASGMAEICVLGMANGVHCYSHNLPLVLALAEPLSATGAADGIMPGAKAVWKCTCAVHGQGS